VAVFRPPAEKRLPIVSGWMVSRTVKALLPVGRSRRRSAFSVDPSSGCAGRAAVWPAAGEETAIRARARSAAARSR
jgi:hypothetical protein